MSVMRSNGERVVLPRIGREEFWERIHDRYAKGNARRWKGLAILALRENAGWPLEEIGEVFGHHKGHISRILVQVKKELRDEFGASPDRLCLGEEDDDWRSCPNSNDETGFSNPARID